MLSVKLVIRDFTLKLVSVRTDVSIIPLTIPNRSGKLETLLRSVKLENVKICHNSLSIIHRDQLYGIKNAENSNSM